MFSLEQVVKIINSQNYIDGNCFCQKHQFNCNKYAFSCLLNTVKASYKTYAIVYIIQILINLKKIRNKPKQEIPRIIWNYIKSVSFTAVEMMIMRRFLCFYLKSIKSSSNGLIPSNIIGGLYLNVQSKNRQIQIALYALNKTIQTVYNCLKRRNPNIRVKNGQIYLFAFSMALISHFYFSDKQLFRPAYKKLFSSLYLNS